MGKKAKKSGDDGGASTSEGADSLQDETAQIDGIYAKKLRAERSAELEKLNDRFAADTLTLKEKLSEKSHEHDEMLRYMEEKDKEKEAKLKALEIEKKRTEDEHNELAKEFNKLREQDNSHWESKVKQLEEKVLELQRKYDETNDFRTQKSSILGKLEEAHTALTEEKLGHETDVADLDRRNIAAKERLKKEMLRKIKETKLSLLAMTEDQLHTTTKRTIMENEQMTIELQYQSKETEKLLAQNAKLQAENTRMKRQIELHMETETMLGTRTHCFQRTVKRLNEQIAFLEEGQRSVDDSTHRLQDAERAAVLQLHEEIERRKDTENLLQEAYNEADTLRDELREVLASHESMMNLQDESLAFIWACLEDTRRAAGLDPTAPLHNDVEMLMKRGNECELPGGGELDENDNSGNKAPPPPTSTATATASKCGGANAPPFRLARPIRSLKDANADERAALLELFLDKLRNFQQSHQSLLHALEANNIRKQTMSPLLARGSPMFPSTDDLLRISRQSSRRHNRRTDSRLSFASNSSASSSSSSMTMRRSSSKLGNSLPPHLGLPSRGSVASGDGRGSKFRRPSRGERGGEECPVAAEEEEHVAAAATGIDPSHPLREWGKRADTIPLNVSGPKLFLKKNHRSQ